MKKNIKLYTWFDNSTFKIFNDNLKDIGISPLKIFTASLGSSFFISYLQNICFFNLSTIILGAR